MYPALRYSFWLGVLCFIALSLPTFAEQNQLLIPMDAVWRYNSSGEAPAPEWIAKSYDDSAWPIGAALLGHEDNTVYLEPIRTELNLNASGSTNSVLSYYFRASFNFPTNPAGVRLIGGVLVDDGALFYLNGNRVGSINISSGSTFPTNQYYESYYEVIEFPTGSLVEGQNTIAVEVRQSHSESSDVMFGMTVFAVWPESARIVTGPSMEGGTLGQATSFRAQAGGSEPVVIQWLKNGAPIQGATNSGYRISTTQSSHAGQYSVTVSNSLGSVTSDSINLMPASDTSPPVLITATNDINFSNFVVLTFSEAVDSRTSTNVSNYSLTSDGNSIQITNAQYGFGNKIRLKTTTALDPSKAYQVTVLSIRDPAGNQSTQPQTTNVVFLKTILPLEQAQWRFSFKPLYGDLSHEWTSLTYDDSNWAGPYSGILSSSNALHQMPGTRILPISRTIYFRNAFLRPTNKAEYATLRIRHWVDDGAIFYLNGSELFRTVPSSVASYNDFAGFGGDEKASSSGPVTSPYFEGNYLLRPGTNVLAAELHQGSEWYWMDPNFPSSIYRPDVLFAAGLEGWVQTSGQPNPLHYRREGDSLILSWTDADAELQSADAVDGPWQIIQTTAQTYSQSSTLAAKFFRLSTP